MPNIDEKSLIFVANEPSSGGEPDPHIARVKYDLDTFNNDPEALSLATFNQEALDSPPGPGFAIDFSVYFFSVQVYCASSYLHSCQHRTHAFVNAGFCQEKPYYSDFVASSALDCNRGSRATKSHTNTVFAGFSSTMVCGQTRFGAI